MRARNATDILSQVWVTLCLVLLYIVWLPFHYSHLCLKLRLQPVNQSADELFSVPQTKYKQTAEMDRASYTTVIDTPDIIHAQQMRNIVSQVNWWSETTFRTWHYSTPWLLPSGFSHIPHTLFQPLLSQFYAKVLLFVLLSNRKSTKRRLRRPCLTTYQSWTLRRCRESVRTRRTSAL